MKTLVISVIVVLCITGFTQFDRSVAGIDFEGAWNRETDGNRIVWISAGKYFAATVYNEQEKKFVGTCGGSWKIEGDKFIEVHEFNTMDPDRIGKEMTSSVEMKNGKLVFDVNGKKEEWTRIDNGKPGDLSGAWLITGRMNDGKMNKMTPGARRTMKILSGTRFQWIAYNVETKEFFGTGGGNYTTSDGKYKEIIDFFSRDASRIGMTLSFDYALEDGNWRHKGLSSKGDPIDEVWTKREQIGI